MRYCPVCPSCHLSIGNARRGQITHEIGAYGAWCIARWKVIRRQRRRRAT